MITFPVADVTRTDALLKVTSMPEALRSRLNRAFEAAGCNASAPLVQSWPIHGFIAAVDNAFDAHYPLILAPDDVWLCLAQGLAMHINHHAEALRHRFVQHEGKVEITVRRDNFVKDSPDNDWPSVFSEMSDGVAKHIGKNRDLFVADFSTTGPIERAASEIVLLEAMQQYFDFSCLTMCGIPEITLLGTVKDWESIRTRVHHFAEFDVHTDNSHWQKWSASMVKILDKVILTARGKVDRAFWQSFYKLNGGSGGPYINGWINALFPYTERQDYKTDERSPTPNAYALRWEEAMASHHGGGPMSADFPSGISSAPFMWEYLGRKIPMSFMAGFAGISQDPTTKAIRPAMGWAIGER